MQRTHTHTRTQSRLLLVTRLQTQRPETVFEGLKLLRKMTQSRRFPDINVKISAVKRKYCI